MNDSAPSTLVAPQRRRRLQRVVLVLFLLLLVVVWGAAFLWYGTERALREAEAEVDRLDPGWRLADLEAARAEIPDAENGAFQVQAVRALLPSRWPPWPGNGDGESDLDAGIDQLAPPVRLDEQQTARLRAELGKVAPAVAAARRLTDFPQGRYPLSWSPDGIGTLMPHVEQMDRVTRLLRLDVVRLVQDGDVDGACASCRALVHTGRSLGDESTLIAQLMRLRCQRSAVKGLERTLAQGEPTEAALEAVQCLLADEEQVPLQLRAFRAERATVHQFLVTVETGKFDRNAYKLVSPTGSYQVDNLLDGGRALATHVAYLRYLSELVEIAKLPPEQQGERLEQPGLEAPQGVPVLLQALSRGEDHRKITIRFHTTRGTLRSAVAAVAAERYRRHQGHWPERLEDLVPAYLPAVPANPFDGRPLDYHREPDGVWIRAPRPHTSAEAQPTNADPDPSFRLWDAAARHRPANQK
jgi:hypothetical protein